VTPPDEPDEPGPPDSTGREVGAPDLPRARAYTPKDRGPCLALFDSNVPRYFLPHERGEFESFLEDLPGPYVVLVLGDEIVACGGYAWSAGGRRVDLCWGMVRRRDHGRGLGRHLTLARLDSALRHPEVEEVGLSTSQRTAGFYERLGFRVVAVESDGYGPGLDRCEMRLRRA